MATSAKHAKLDATTREDKLIFYAPQKLFSRQIEGMKRAISALGCETTDYFRQEVSHIVTGLTFEEDVWEKLKSKPLPHVNVVSPLWHADSIRAKCLLPVEEYRLIFRRLPPSTQPEELHQEDSNVAYSCQRSTPLKHHNSKFTDALETLSQAADLRGDDINYSRSLAFRRCSSVLKSLPYKVSNISQVRKKKDVGQHCLKVIEDILEFGSSKEVDSLLDNEWFTTMKIFTSVFGVGSATAKDWYSRGFRNLEDVIKSSHIRISNDLRLSIGLAYNEDLSMPVSLKEAEHWQDFICSILKDLDQEVRVDITGGFRRRKQHGHDVDLLISHPKDGKETGLLTKVLDILVSKSLVLYGRYEKPSFTEERLKDDTKHTPLKSTLDHFEKWIGVVKMNRGLLDVEGKVSSGDQHTFDEFIPDSLRTLISTNGEQTVGKNVGETCDLAKYDRDWVARRVDLIVTPANQYPYALVGWTGSKEFNRSLRWYAQRELNYKLTSHGIWDFNEGKSVQALSEKDVFHQLKLPYLEPQERNC